MKRSLIINADDLGYTHGINRAIELCAGEGMLRSATIMANGPAFEDAVAVAKRNAGLSVGVHLVLTGLPPLSRPADVPGLLDRDGRLPSSLTALASGLLSGKISRRVLLHELDLQVTKVLDHGITPTHLDSHKHVHLLPEVLEAVATIASRYSIRWIRNPFDGTAGNLLFPSVAPARRAVFLKQHLSARLVGICRPVFFRILRKAHLQTPDNFYGVSLTGIWSDEALRRFIQQVPPGLSECMLHPGICDEELRLRGTRLRQSREVERDLLLSPLLKELIRQHRIILAAYGEKNP